jgi:hypothetical protein
MRKLEADSAANPPAWLGLLWVYAAVFWLWLLGKTAINGDFAAALPVLLRMVATMAVGVGLCAGERWAWAPAVVLAGLYGAIAALAAGIGLVALVRLPGGWLSWRSVIAGMNASTTFTAIWLLTSTAAICGGTLSVLWKRREAYDVASRRSFTPLVHEGIIPALGVLLLDGWAVKELLAGGTFR